MSVIAAAVKHMLAAGMPHDEILLAIAAMEASLIPQQPGRTARQERNRRYYEARKERLKASESRLKASDSDDSDGGASEPGSRAQKTPTPPKTTSKQSPPSAPKGASDPHGVSRHRGGILPEDWQVKAKHYAKAAERGFDRTWVDGQADALREWAWGNRNRAIARKADWDLTFDGWLRREMDKARNGRQANTYDPGQGDRVLRLIQSRSVA